jgi:hypothetical protein
MPHGTQKTPLNWGEVRAHSRGLMPSARTSKAILLTSQAHQVLPHVEFILLMGELTTTHDTKLL